MARVRTAAADPDHGPRHVLHVEALAEAQTLPRIAGLLAQFGILPAAFSSTLVGDRLALEIAFTADAAARIDIVLAKMQTMVVVARADLAIR